MGTAYILIGLPGSGKSTWAKEQSGCLILNRDSIRLMFYGGKYDFRTEDESLILHIMFDCARQVAEQDRDVIIDETGVNAATRTGYVFLFKAANYKVVYVMFTTPKGICIDRRSKDTKGIPQDWAGVINKMAAVLKEPDDSEGHDELWTIE